MRDIEFTYYQRPGNDWEPHELKKRVSEYRELAKTCLDEVPDYQCLSFNPELFRQLVIVEARYKGELYGLISSIILDVPSKKNVIHLGLTLVHPKSRGLGLTHKLTSKLLIGYIIRNSLFQKVWVTNVACVLSSLSNVALHFQDVYPSPQFNSNPTKEHCEIADWVDLHYRNDIFIPKEAKFNPETFIFESSVKGNMFEKDAWDKRYLHRKNYLNNYYRKLIDFSRGDELLQVGYFSLMSYPLYRMNKIMTKFLLSFKNPGHEADIQI